MKDGIYIAILRNTGGIVMLIWMFGLMFDIGDSLVHILLIIAIIFFIMDIIIGRGKRAV